MLPFIFLQNPKSNRKRGSVKEPDPNGSRSPANRETKTANQPPRPEVPRQRGGVGSEGSIGAGRGEALPLGFVPTARLGDVGRGSKLGGWWLGTPKMGGGLGKGTKLTKKPAAYW